MHEISNPGVLITSMMPVHSASRAISLAWTASNPARCSTSVIGAVLRSRQGVALRHAVHPVPAFIDGYHAALAVTIALIAAGMVIAYLTLRRAPGPAGQTAVPVPAAGTRPAETRPHAGIRG